MVGTTYGWDKMLPIIKRLMAGESITALERETSIDRATIRKYRDKHLSSPQTPTAKTIAQKFIASKTKEKDEPPAEREAKLLFLDIETLPNQGWFFDTYSDRSIPLTFIKRPKAICTIAYKFAGEEKPTVLCAAKPYDDKDILQQILPVVEQAHYVVWHYGEGFDRQFIDGRLLVNGLPALPPVNSIDTYKLARSKFGKTLNSNKLDHLGDLLGVGRKNKTDATLWVRCAEGDPEALQEMAEYNAQDIELLEAVYYRLAPNVKNKVNYNLLHDDPVLRCKPCGSTNIALKGYELVNATWRHRYQCQDCGAWSTFPKQAGSK
jgi:hypothetical protein